MARSDILLAQFPGGGDVNDYYVDLSAKNFKLWKDTPDFTYDPKVSFFSMLVPTVDTVVRYSFVFTKSLLFTG